MTDPALYIKNALSGLYYPGEIRGLTSLILERVCGMLPYEWILREDKNLLPNQEKRVKEIIGRLIEFEPIQYIIGSTEFYSLPIDVTPAVLIPRPETEELVDIIIKEDRMAGESILDIGTGSGCIAIALAKHIREAKVTALDISPEALSIAQSNARKNGTDITFLQADILNPPADLPLFDRIVSNPPYICEAEKTNMSRNVLEHEPRTALFVPDEDPLLFYRAIAGLGRKHLTEEGRIYLEINARFGTRTVSLLQEEGYKEVSLLKDLSGNDRIVKAIK